MNFSSTECVPPLYYFNGNLLRLLLHCADESTDKKLGALIVRNKDGNTTGIITDGNIRRIGQKNKDIQSLTVKDVMTLNPISINFDALAVKALSIMNEKKITSLCVSDKKNKKKTIGIIHIHNILQANIV